MVARITELTAIAKTTSFWTSMPVWMVRGYVQIWSVIGHTRIIDPDKYGLNRFILSSTEWYLY